MELGRQGNLVVSWDRRPGRLRFMFWCPGCEDAHAFEVGPQHTGEHRPSWQFDGNTQSPTVQPSIVVRYGDEPGAKRCHLFLVNGQLQFLGDCTHKLAGQTVPLPEPPEWLC